MWFARRQEARKSRAFVSGFCEDFVVLEQETGSVRILLDWVNAMNLPARREMDGRPGLVGN